MSFTWNDNIPGPNDPFSQSQGQLQTNLNTLNSVFNVDHVPYTPVNATQGQHKQITFNAPLAPAAPAGTVGLGYTKTVVTSGSSGSELHYRNAAKESQITFSGLTSTPTNGVGGLPGGLQIRAAPGQASVAGTANGFTPEFPTACVAVALAADNADNIVQVFSKAAGSFVAKSAGGTCSLYYIAIGY